MTNTDLFPIGLDRAPSKLHRYNEIPTLHFTANPTDVANMHDKYNDDIEIKGNLTFIRATKVKQYGNVTLSIGGRSSRQFTKMPYNFDLNHGDDLGGYRKLKLRTLASDPSYIRERLALDMLYAAHRPASRASHVSRVYINDQAAGLFLLTEKYTDGWLRREYDHDDPAYANGALYKCKGDVPERQLYADLSYHPENASVYNELYKLDQEAADGGDSGMMPLIDFTKFIDEQLKWQQDNQDNLEDSTDAWEEQLNVYGFLANMALEFLLASWDGYLGNAQNYYLYKEPKTGEMDWIGWDYDFTFGSGTVKMDKMVAGNASEFSGVATRPLMRAVLGIPSYQDTFDAQIDAMNQVFFNERVIFPIIDAWTLFLQQDIAWDQALTPVRAGRSFASMLKHGANGPSLNTMGGGAGMSYPLDYDQGTGADFLFRANTLIPSKAAIDGPTNHPSLMGLKEFILKKSDNINAYYNSTQ
ncbi:coth protein-domain-containing protein [Gongronella butleri]|nr:coth protein-domain-containing protein [Gongronella butleri]